MPETANDALLKRQSVHASVAMYFSNEKGCTNFD